MGIEIERKFLVANDAWRGGEGLLIRQGYLCVDKARTVRVRTLGSEGFLTVKGTAKGLRRAEYEYPIPLDDANELLDQLCGKPLLEKTRYRIPFGGFVWEVDEYGGLNQGLIVAEVELAAADQEVPLPPWVGAEVSGDFRYANSNLVANPFSAWPS